MSELCHRAVSRHIEFLSRSFVCTENGEYSGIATPYTYGDFDAIEMYVRERNGGGLVLTDLGTVLEHAAITCGRDILSSQEDKVKQVISKHDLMLVEGEIVSLCAYDDVGDAMLRLAMAAKEIDGLTRLARPQRVGNFDARVGTYFSQRGVKFLHKQKLAGASGEKYLVDYMVQAPAPAVAQTVGHESGSAKFYKTLMAFEDLKETGQGWPLLAVVERSLGDSKMSLLRKKADEVYLGNQLDELLRDLKVS